MLITYIDHYNAKGWVVIRNAVPADTSEISEISDVKLSELRHLQNLSNYATNYVRQRVGHPSTWGAPRHWNSLEMASKYVEGFNIYLSKDWLVEPVKQFLGCVDPYLYNDQSVVKLPVTAGEMVFEAHNDNSYVVVPDELKNDVEFRTVNATIFLDDQWEEMENGGIEICSKDTGKWEFVGGSQGDILFIDGETMHRSGQNMSNDVRRNWCVVFSALPMNLERYHNIKVSELTYIPPPVVTPPPL